MLQLKSPWPDGTADIVMSALEFMQRLAALVPRPRLFFEPIFAMTISDTVPTLGVRIELSRPTLVNYAVSSN